MEVGSGAEFAALVEACRSLATRIDATARFDDKLWREYRLALAGLMGAVRDGRSDEYDAISTEFADLDAALGHTKNT